MRNLILLTLTVFVMLGLCEVFVRLFVPLRTIGPTLKRYDPVYGEVMKSNLRILE